MVVTDTKTSQRNATRTKRNKSEKVWSFSPVTFVMMFVLLRVARALNLFPVANRSKLLISCFCSLGLLVLARASSKASKSSLVIEGRDSRTYKQIHLMIPIVFGMKVLLLKIMTRH